MAAIDNMDQAMLQGKVLKVAAAKPQKEANEGLGSKIAVWNQVRIGIMFQCLNYGFDADMGMLRRAGWKNMRSVRRIGPQRSKRSRRCSLRQAIRCKDFKD